MRPTDEEFVAMARQVCLKVLPEMEMSLGQAELALRAGWDVIMDKVVTLIDSSAVFVPDPTPDSRRAGLDEAIRICEEERDVELRLMPPSLWPMRRSLSAFVERVLRRLRA